jgi:hypothetical protein
MNTERTSWHELADVDVGVKLDELNRRLAELSFRTRFRIVRDEYGWDIVVDDGGKPELVETVEEDEYIVGELSSVAGWVNEKSDSGVNGSG